MNDQSNANGSAREQIISIWGGEINMRVRIAGSGPALVYFHPAGGLYWDEFLDGLTKSYTVYAPELPGTTPGDPYAIYKVDTYNDLLLMYEEVIRSLQLEQPIAVGQSMGGMVALDLASTYTSMFSQAIGLAPVGLWQEDLPVGIADLYSLPPEQVPAYLFHNPNTPAVGAMFGLPEDPEAIPAHVAQNVWSLGCAGKFLWPIPDHGLRKRLHRISIPTLILWGEQDRLVPVGYSEQFAKGIKNCTVNTLKDCGHIVQMEQTKETLQQVQKFLG